MPRSTASQPASHARTSRLRAGGRASKGRELNCFSTLLASLRKFDPLGLCSRMFPDCYLPTRAATLRSCNTYSWGNAGMGYHGAFSTASFSESPNVAVVCSLSAVLESHVPQRFFLSPRAAAGILRRAAKRGRRLPPQLQEALAGLAAGAAKRGQYCCPNPHENARIYGGGCETVRKTLLSGKRSARTTPSTGPAGRETGNGTTLLQLPLPLEAIPTAPRQAEGGKTITTSLSRPCEDQGRERPEAAAPSFTPKTSFASPIPFDPTQVTSRENRSNPQPGDPAPTLAKGAQPPAVIQPIPCDVTPEPSKPKTPTSSSPSRSLLRKGSKATRPKITMSVRRLTPTECEALQGFPKGWTVPDTKLWATQSRSRSRNGSEGES